MSIFAELLKEHDLLKGLCLDIKEVGDDPARRAAVLQDFRLHLVAHARAEEQTLYVRTAKADAPDTLEGSEEHHVMDGIVDELVRLEVGDERWIPKIEVLRETALHHLREEEENLFPRAERMMDADEAERMGSAYRAAFAAAWQQLEGTTPVALG
jgi:hemerythrin superfamily protein